MAASRTLDDASTVVWLGARGLTCRMEGERLIVAPERLITPAVDAYIRKHRDTIAGAVTDPDLWRLRRERYGRLSRGELEP